MSKRKPGSELNDRNWDEEDEPEEAGTFQLADQDVLRARTIRKAKRTVHTAGGGSGGSVFAGFALKTADSSVPKPAMSTGVTLNFGSNLNFQPKSNGTSQQSAEVNNGSSDENPEYLRQLKVLNENILSWIQKHVGDNPYCILTPSFKDYEKHLADLEKKYGVKVAGGTPGKTTNASTGSGGGQEKTAPSLFGSAGTGPMAGFFGQSAAAKSDVDSDKEKSESKAGGLSGCSGFSFGTGLTKTDGFGTSNFSQGASVFGVSSSGSTPATFSFAAAAPKPDSSGAGQTSSNATGAGEDEYEPPKVEVREIKEDGAVYTKRCKLFYQKDGQWADRGVGNLHLKLTDGGRTQLIVRADTNLGNILLNILLTPAIPTKRQGKNNVFLVCTPNPPLDPKNTSTDPVPMLIRVKTAEDADELLAKMEELKGDA
ncbi:nuclear pore complex protein Nup50-like [Littorina saxatilis]|uniref:RanBD1 domain-containing protein n=1 Tax=Littorina saxatilis TaxID=31220 RepID=A0AAN9G9D3_9CAEN